MKNLFVVAPALLLVACGSRVEKFEMPSQVANFAELYQGNCAGCHGREGRSGAARPLNSSAFLAVIGEQELTDVIAKGVPQTAMAAFSKNAGGDLTDQQIAILARGIKQQWSRPQGFSGIVLPSYRGELGDPRAGAEAFNRYCKECHGDAGAGGPKGPSVVDPSFLALTSNQSLRTTAIAGRESTPDWRSYVPDQAMTSKEISDVVAWLASFRPPAITMTQRGRLP